MAWGMVRVNVQDYQRWKPAFDAFAQFRGEYGSKGGFVFRDADDPNRVTVLIEYPDIDSFRRLAVDPRLAEAQRQGGVIPPPEMFALEEVDRPAM